MRLRPSTRKLVQDPGIVAGSPVGEVADWIGAFTYENGLNAWSESDVAAANVNPYLFTLPLIQQLTQDLSAHIFLHRERHRMLIFQRSPNRSIQSLKPTREDVDFLLLSNEGLNHRMDGFTTFIKEFRKVLNINDEIKDAKYCGYLDYCKEVFDDGTRMLEDIKGHLQSEIGLWSIDESRRSIEEAVSVKRLTQLAFIFLPLNFVTSLYGMNIQEMTGNGIRLWIFFITAICVTLSSIFIWRVLEPLQIFWKRLESFRKERPESTFSD